MILFNEKEKSFLLSGKDYGYAAFVNKAGFLQHLYYGDRIQQDDVAFLIKEHAKNNSPNPENQNYDTATDYMPSECMSFAHGNFREPTVIVERLDGAAMSRFKYKCHKIYKGTVKIEGMPCIRRGDETLCITLKDDFSDTELDLNYTVLADSSVLVRNTVIRNVGEKALNVKKAYSFCVDFPDSGNYSALRLAGKWAKERRPVTTPIAEGVLRLESNYGYSSHQMNPFLAVLEEGCEENNGTCYGFNLIYSGSFAITAELNCHGLVTVQGGINDQMFSWRLNGGEQFVTPQVTMCYSKNGLGEMSRSYHDFFRQYIINPDYVYKRRPIVVNNWEATYFDFDNEKLFKIIDQAGKSGIDTFVLDDGWFGQRNDDKRGLGDWFVNEKKLEGGLKAVIDRCKQNGLKFGLWFEPEMVNEDSDLYRAHPDWALKKADVEPARHRNQLILDFTKQEVVDHVYEMISKILSENDISYVKWDKNREMTELYTDSLPADRQGELSHRYTLGFYNLAERLTKAFPNVFFEGCAGGGGRFDGGAMYYFPQIWTSDDTDALERTKIQWGTSLCYPLSTMSCHVSACPNHQTRRMTPFETRGAIASLGATGYELDLSKLTDEEKEQVKLQVEAYKQIDDIILQGDLYRLSNPYTQEYFCEMVVTKDKSRAYLVGERFRGDPSDHDRILKLYGLDENKTYYIKELDLKASGKALMGAGLLYPRLSDCGSWIWHIDEV